MDRLLTDLEFFNFGNVITEKWVKRKLGVVHKLRSQSGGRGGQGNVYVCLQGGRGGFVKSLRSFLGPIFFKKLYFYKGWLHDIFT